MYTYMVLRDVKHKFIGALVRDILRKNALGTYNEKFMFLLFLTFLFNSIQLS